MQTDFFPSLNDQGIMPLDNAELLSTFGGDTTNFLMDAAAFLIAPGFGFFYLGLKTGYQQAAAE